MESFCAERFVTGERPAEGAGDPVEQGLHRVEVVVGRGQREPGQFGRHVAARAVLLRIEEETKLQLIVAAELERRNQQRFAVLDGVGLQQRNQQLARGAGLVLGTQPVRAQQLLVHRRRDRRFGRTYLHLSSHAEMGHPEDRPGTEMMEHLQALARRVDELAVRSAMPDEAVERLGHRLVRHVGGEAAYYLGVNRNKRSVRLDLMKTEAKALRRHTFATEPKNPPRCRQAA